MFRGKRLGLALWGTEPAAALAGHAALAESMGFDSVWVGTVGNGRIDGTWTTNELVTGQPTRGSWTAVRESGR